MRGTSRWWIYNVAFRLVGRTRLMSRLGPWLCQRLW